MNIYQAALKLRNDFAHTGIDLEACDNKYTNLYFIYHDSLHTYLSAEPKKEDEPVVLSAEMILGGQELTLEVDIDYVTTKLGSIPSEVLEELIDFYINWFNQ